MVSPKPASISRHEKLLDPAKKHVLQAGLPETTHLAHKANHFVKSASLRQSKQS